MTWLERNTLPLSALSEAKVVHAALDAIATRLDGKAASANTISRRRAILYNALEHAVELEYFEANLIDRVKWTAPKVAEAVDRRVVVNHEQARALLAAVRAQGETGRRLVAFFACMYYAALRPGEVTALREQNLDLLEEGWGELHLCESVPSSAQPWTDSGERETRQLKHRAKEEVRVVPCAPPLTALLREHLEEFGTAPDGRPFQDERGRHVPTDVYSDVWQKARAAALSPAEVASPLAARPYDLRHAAVST